MIDTDIRYDLVPSKGIEEVAKIMTDKLATHEPDAWRAGINWSELLCNLKAHLAAFEQGKDFDEHGRLNIAHVASQALLLAEAYKVFPYKDDRKIGMQKKPIICCDLDDVIFSFTESYEARFGKMSDYWSGSYDMLKGLSELQKDREWWVNLPVKNRPTFEIDYYVTARSIPVEWTEAAIAKNNLPTAKVISLPWNVSKIDTLKELGCQLMIDDKYQTYKECCENGIFCYLLSTKANQYYQVGHRRIENLNINI